MIKTLKYYRKILPYTAVIQEALLRKVNANNIESFDFNRETWFTSHRWSEEEEEEFKIALIDWFKETPLARKEIFYNSSITNLYAKVSSLLFHYGWSFE